MEGQLTAMQTPAGQAIPTGAFTPEPMVAPPRRRRSPTLFALGVALVAVSALGGVFALQTQNHRVEVLAVARSVPLYQKISANDLTVASIATDSTIKPVAAHRRSEVVGKYAAVALRKGQIVTADSVTGTPGPALGQVLVPIGVRPGQYPAGMLQPGMRVLIVAVPAGNADPTTVSVKDTDVISGTFAGIQKTSAASDVVTLNVLVSGRDAPLLSARAATGRITILVTG
jgi:SAF domain